MLLVVAYDIADDRRRVRLHTLLLGYGVPVQESVFECDVSERRHVALQRRVARIIRHEVDSVRYYALCADCARKIQDGLGTPLPQEPTVYIV